MVIATTDADVPEDRITTLIHSRTEKIPVVKISALPAWDTSVLDRSGETKNKSESRKGKGSLMGAFDLQGIIPGHVIKCQ